MCSAFQFHGQLEVWPCEVEPPTPPRHERMLWDWLLRPGGAKVEREDFF
jgi:hypothetical protein